MELWRSLYLFFWGIFKRFYYWIPALLLDPFDIYEPYIKSALPGKWQIDIVIPNPWAISAFLVLFLWAAILTYHELRRAHQHLVSKTSLNHGMPERRRKSTHSFLG